jgi:dUTP pyrophosphatase
VLNPDTLQLPEPRTPLYSLIQQRVAETTRPLAERLGAWRMMNSRGALVDSGYRGEIKIIAVNLDPTMPIEIKRGDRIAQMVILKVERAELEVVDTLPQSERGEGGHGSTGR